MFKLKNNTKVVIKKRIYKYKKHKRGYKIFTFF